ncbi:MAG TPA: ATP-dependent 6-phosphofructokinase [Thermoguttaceae bacterium]|nr:ATP-dependent 6-phosphofructokinase [Thermoguttaceae bacterium]
MTKPTQIVSVPCLGPADVPSPLRRSSKPGDGFPKFVPPTQYVRHPLEWNPQQSQEEMLFEKAGPRQQIFFDPRQVRAALVTCGGLCPGLNNVIRSAFLELHMNYGVPEVLGIRYGFRGLNPAVGDPPIRLTLEMVERIHQTGGTILGSSRGPQEAAVMVDFLVDQKIQVLLCIGGDGTQQGAQKIFEEIQRRRLPIAVVGVPKTIDNDILYCERSFGFTTAVAEAARVLDCAHMESKGAPYGIGLVKLMGRESGFIAAAATLASQEVNFTLIPESPFVLEGEGGFLAALRRRLLDRRHAVIVVAEGAGQDLLGGPSPQRDASGNRKLQDIGLFLKERITAYFAEHGPEVSLKYIDPSYIIRSVPASSEDDILCDQFARHAVHAAMAGKTGMMIGLQHGAFIHVPWSLSVGRRRYVEEEGDLWAAVLAATGQPKRFQ